MGMWAEVKSYRRREHINMSISIVSLLIGIATLKVDWVSKDIIIAVLVLISLANLITTIQIARNRTKEIASAKDKSAKEKDQARKSIEKVYKNTNDRIAEVEKGEKELQDRTSKRIDNLESDLSKSKQEIESARSDAEERIRNIQKNMSYEIQRAKQDTELAQDYLNRASSTIIDVTDQRAENRGKDTTDCIECVRRLSNQLSEYDEEMRNRLIQDEDIRKTSTGKSAYQFRSAEASYKFDGRLAPCISGDAFESKNAEWLKKHEKEK